MSPMKVGEPFGNVVTFCPAFFRMLRGLEEKRKVKGREWNLPQLITKEHAMVHEFFHCRSALGLQFDSESFPGFALVSAALY